MNDKFSQTDLKELMQQSADHAVSLYMPANRVSTETQKDIIRLKNLVNQAQDELQERGMRRPDAVELLKPAHALLEDADFWQNQSHGLAIFLAPEITPQIYRLPIRLVEMCHVAERFYTKPLVRLFSHDGQYFVLALSQNDVRLFKGNRDGLDQEPIENLPTDIEDALGTWQSERELQYHTGTGKSGNDGRQSAMFHGHAGSDVDMKDELRRFFRHIDEVLHPQLRTEKAPLVLAAVDYLHHIYKEVSSYSHLLDKGYEGNPDELSEQDLHKATWEIVAPIFQAELKADQEQFAELAGTGRTGAYVDEVAVAAFQGRIETAFLAQGARVWGKFDPKLGKVVQQTEPTAATDAPDSNNEDLLDFIALHTFLNGGTVHVPPPEDVPGESTAAAIYRF